MLNIDGTTKTLNKEKSMNNKTANTETDGILKTKYKLFMGIQFN